MEKQVRFSHAEIELLSEKVASNFTGSKIGTILLNCRFKDPGTITKRFRISGPLINAQNVYYDKILKNEVAYSIKNIPVMRFIYYSHDPAYFFDTPDEYQKLLWYTNSILSRFGFKFTTERRFDRLKNDKESELRLEFNNRGISMELQTACVNWFLLNDYFHGMFEVSKFVLKKISKKSTITHLDGVKLIETVFTPKRPILQLNDLKTSSETNEQAGFKDLVNGIHRMVRNPLAHEMVAEWQITHEYALDFLNIANLILRRLESTELNHKNLDLLNKKR